MVKHKAKKGGRIIKFDDEEFLNTYEQYIQLLAIFRERGFEIPSWAMFELNVENCNPVILNNRLEDMRDFVTLAMRELEEERPPPKPVAPPKRPLPKPVAPPKRPLPKPVAPPKRPLVPPLVPPIIPLPPLPPIQVLPQDVREAINRDIERVIDISRQEEPSQTDLCDAEIFMLKLLGDVYKLDSILVRKRCGLDAPNDVILIRDFLSQKAMIDQDLLEELIDNMLADNIITNGGIGGRRKKRSNNKFLEECSKLHKKDKYKHIPWKDFIKLCAGTVFKI